MNVQTLVNLIAAFCIHETGPKASIESKEICIERVVNCAVVGAGEVRSDYQVCFKKELTNGK